MADETRQIGKILQMAGTQSGVVIMDHHMKLYYLNLDNHPLVGWEELPKDICNIVAVVEQPEHIGAC